MSSLSYGDFSRSFGFRIRYVIFKMISADLMKTNENSSTAKSCCPRPDGHVRDD
jgi:hypothetical protein